MCPSENIIYVIKKDRIDAALSYNPHLTLMDFISNWDVLTNSKKIFISDEYSYWYCTECKRVTLCEIHIGGKALSVYQPVVNESTIVFNELSKMEELVVFSNIAEDNATEKDAYVSLKSFLKSLPEVRYFISADKRNIYGYDCNVEQITFVYQSEAIMTDK